MNINQVIHKSFIGAAMKKDRNHKGKFKRRKFNRSIGLKTTKEITNVILVDEGFLEPSIKLHPEAIAYLFFINGCSKNLFFFLVLRKLDLQTGEYTFNRKVVQEFLEYSEEVFDSKYTESTIQQAHRDLVDAHITCNKTIGLYLMNAMVVGGTNTDTRRDLVNKYSMLLASKPNNSIESIYPVYRKR